MYYRLKDKYFLRGWDKLPYAIVDSSTGNARFLSPNVWQAVELCDGSFDFSEPFVPDSLKQIVSEEEKNGFIEKCNSGEGLNANQLYKKYPCRYINSVQWSITGKCNYRCKHCYMSAPDVNAHQLPHDDIMHIIDQLAENGVMRVSITGGEPLIRDDFFDIVDALHQRNIVITQIYSNGALVTKKFLSELDKRNIHPAFIMSYDGTDGWHDWIRGVNGAGVLIDRAFSLCSDMGFHAMANMTLHQGNLHTLRDTINHLASMGVVSIKTAYAGNIGEWKTKNSGNAIDIKDVFQAYLDYIPHYYEDGMPIGIFLTSFFTTNPDNPDEYTIVGYNDTYNPEDTLLCGHARSSSYISPDGRPLMCGLLAGISLQNNFPSLSDLSFAECISTPQYMNLIDMRASYFLKVNTTCGKCKFNKHCYGGCRGVALLEDEHNLMGTASSVCEMFYGGWIKKIVDTMKKVRPSAKCPVNDITLL